MSELNKPRSYPTLSVLSVGEVHNDLQQLINRRPAMFPNQQLVVASAADGPLNLGVPIPIGPPREFGEYNNALGFSTGQAVPPPPSFGPASDMPPFPRQQPAAAPNLPYPPHAGPRRSTSNHQQNIAGGHRNDGRPPGQAHGPGFVGAPHPPQRLSPSPPMHGYDRPAMNGHLGPVANGPSHPSRMGPPPHTAGPSSSKVNGWGKDRRVASGGQEVQQFDLRDQDARFDGDMARDRDRRERLREGPGHQWDRDGYHDGHRPRDREREPEYDEHGRPLGPLPPGSHPHRHTLQHHSLQGIPHHHHVVHRHHPSHHHHDPGRPSGSSSKRHEGDRQVDGPEYEHRSRRPGHIDHPSNGHGSSKLNGSSPHWHPPYNDFDRGDRERERDRGRVGGGPSSHFPIHDRPPSSAPFPVGPPHGNTHAGPSSSRRDRWEDGHARPPTFGEGPPMHGHPMDGGSSRHGPIHRLPSPPRQISRSALPSPRHNGPPPSPPPLSGYASAPLRSPRNQHPPTPHHTSSHPSPRVGPMPSKSTRPISPLPAKILPSPLFPPAGPGTPGGGGGLLPSSGSRIGTPQLTGPGTRAEAPLHLPSHPNGHAPSYQQGLTGPGSQPHLPTSNTDTPPHLVAPKMSAVPLGP